MKTFFNWLLVAVCLFSVGNARVMADDKKEDAPSVPIPLITGGVVTGSNHRGSISIPFTAYYQGSAIYISTFAEFSAITITVENETTGQEWNSTTDISDGMGEISIINGAAGNYTVEIVTEYGDCFVGSFGL